MFEVRREDGELCGFVRESAHGWQALTVFAVRIADAADEEAARAIVLQQGLACLAERWELRARCEPEWQVVRIQEANSRRVRVAFGRSALPGVPTRDISVDELRAGEFELRRRR